MIGWRWNGVAYVRATSVPLSDLGFRVGWSAFESFAVRGGEPEFLDEHLLRLQASCETLRLRWDKRALERETIRKTLARRSGFARIYVTAGEGQPRIFMLCEPRVPLAEEVYTRGWCVDTQPEPHFPAFGGLKCGAYAQNWLALERARLDRRMDETLLFDHCDHLISAAVANVIVLLRGNLITPVGGRDGVVRAWLGARHEIEVAEISRADLGEATEIFLTNSWIGIMPVRVVDGRALEMDAGRHFRAEFEARGR